MTVFQSKVAHIKCAHLRLRTTTLSNKKLINLHQKIVLWPENTRARSFFITLKHFFVEQCLS
jgi:hypothetical protein